MTDQGQAIFTFPGLAVGNYDSWSGTDVCGISPASFTATIFPQLGLPKLIGDLQLIQDNRRIVFKDCLLDNVDYDEGTNGQQASVKFLDERWKWSEGYVISGKWNTRLSNNEVDPLYEKTPFQLASLLFAAFEITSFDAEILKSTKYAGIRPPVDWEISNPSQELQKMIDELGLILCPQRSSSLAPTKWVICRTGEGAQLRSDIPYQDSAEGIDPKQKPHALRIFGAPIKYQQRFELEAIGRDIVDYENQTQPIPDDPREPRPLGNADGSWKALENLTYRPWVKDGDTFVRSFGMEGSYFFNVSERRVPQPDGSYQVAQDLANQTVFRCYRLKIPEGGLKIEGYKNQRGESKLVKRNQIVLSNEVVDNFQNADGAIVNNPAFFDFIGYHSLMPEYSQNCEPGTLLGVDTADETDPSSVVTGSINTETPNSSPTSSAGIITFSQPLYRYQIDGEDNADLPAKVWLTCAVTILDDETWQPVRYTLDQVLPDAPTEPAGGYKFVRPVRADDVQLYFKTTYEDGFNESGTPKGQKTVNNELSSLSQFSDTPSAFVMANYYLTAASNEYETVDQQTRTYIGIWPTQLDGAIKQVSYKIGPSGCDTTVSRNREHDLIRQSYKEAQRETLRNDLAAKKQKADQDAAKSVIAKVKK